MASASESLDINSSEEKPCNQAKGTQKKQYKCEVCNKEFQYPSKLREHQQIHTGEKTFLCDYCLKSFSRAANLVRHKMIHTGEKPYKCDQCTKCFGNSTDFASHKRRHSGEKPYRCSLCGKLFCTSSGLTDHKKTHSAERPYQCHECPKTFATPSTLASHKKIHSDQKPFKCDKCDRSFRSSFELKRHKKIHDETRTKGHKCTVCLCSFLLASELTKHMSMHELFKCSLCDKIFGCKEYLRRHAKRHKEKEPDENDQNVGSRIKSEHKRENLSFEHILIKPEPLSECELGPWVNEMEHDLCSGQYPECVKTIVSQDSEVASLTQVEDCHPAEEESSTSFEFVSSTFVEQSVEDKLESCNDVLDIKVKEENIS